MYGLQVYRYIQFLRLSLLATLQGKWHFGVDQKMTLLNLIVCYRQPMKLCCLAHFWVTSRSLGNTVVYDEVTEFYVNFLGSKAFSINSRSSGDGVSEVSVRRFDTGLKSWSLMGILFIYLSDFLISENYDEWKRYAMYAGLHEIPVARLMRSLFNKKWNFDDFFYCFHVDSVQIEVWILLFIINF